jgi:hypothetical protein
MVLVAVPGKASAGPGPDVPSEHRTCEDVHIDGVLPSPPAGSAVRQTVTIDEQCAVRFGPVEFGPNRVAAVAAGDVHTLRAYSTMYDCCGIVMTALSSTYTWRTAGRQITSASPDVRTRVNREPWDGGWTTQVVTSGGGCPLPCGQARYTAHAEFSYQGIFDVTGTWYANVHDSWVAVAGDGTATCGQSVSLRHTFIGWHWVRGCE